MNFPRWFGALALVIAAFWSSGAHAQSCSAGNSSPNFGSLSSFTVNSTPQTTTASASMQCGQLVLAWVTANTVHATMNSQNNFTLRSGANSIPYAIYGDSNYTNQFQQGQINTTTNFAGNWIPFIGGASGSYTLYLRTNTGANVPAGVYTDTVTVTWNARICTVGLLICLAWSERQFNSTISVSLTVVNDCVINAPNLNFGVAPLAVGFGPATQTLNIRCTSGAAYTVGLNDGNNFSAGWRRMRQGATSNYLRYELYKTTTSADRWGSVGAQRRSSASADTNPGIYDGTSSQGFTYRGVVDPTQPTPPVGTYTDNIIVDVQF